jgi:hypothetical protein
VNHIDRASPSTGSSTPASAPTSRDQTPAQQTTMPVSIALRRLDAADSPVADVDPGCGAALLTTAPAPDT